MPVNSPRLWTGGTLVELIMQVLRGISTYPSVSGHISLCIIVLQGIGTYPSVSGHISLCIIVNCFFSYCIVQTWGDSDSEKASSTSFSCPFSNLCAVPSRRVRNANNEYFKTKLQVCYAERGSSAVECRTRNEVSPQVRIPQLLPFRRLGIFVLSIDATVDSAV